MLHDILKFLHVVGAVILIGNVTVTAFWKVFADRTGDAKIIAYAQRLVTLTEFSFTVLGITLILVGGYGMMWVAHLPLNGGTWLIVGQILFFASGLIWICVLVPLQVRQAKTARRWESSGEIPMSYWRDARTWLVWGIVATVPLVATVFIMIAKL